MDLGQVLSDLRSGDRPEQLLVGAETFDDAGVIRLDAERAIVATVDLITPVCDDPYTFGQVAAANSLSDVFAMGGQAIAALNISCFPEDLPLDVTRAILRGGRDKAAEAGAVICGGHSVEDRDLKYGLSVTGLVHPDRILRNCDAAPGDRLILTKPLGTGVGISALKIQVMRSEDEGPMLANMARLNLAAALAALDHEVRSATDVTGFALAGHAFEMARFSGHQLVFDLPALPRYSWFEEYWRAGAVTKVTATNQKLVEAAVAVPEDFSAAEWAFVCDPQTSGGLLLSTPEDQAEALLERLRASGHDDAAIVGEVLPGPGAAAGSEEPPVPSVVFRR